MRVEASKRTNRIAFFEYLDGAPKVENDEDPVQCGELREYFEYDFDYPDDNKIAENVYHIQCRSDFENIDDYATGKNGPAGDGDGEDEDEEEELFVDTTLVFATKKGFDDTGAKVWRSTNFVLQKVIDGLALGLEIAEYGGLNCMAAVSCVPGTAAGCTAVVTGIKLGLRIVLFATEVGIAISERLYKEIVTVQDLGVVSEVRTATYKNVITNHKNIITTFKGVKQLKKQLGDISDTLEEIKAAQADDSDDDSDDGRRMLEVLQEPSETDRCVMFPNTCSCDDPFYLYNCKPNYAHIQVQEFAGCDGQDSDGNSMIDDCEDRFAPTIIFADPLSFVTYSDLTVLQYSKTIFSNKTHVVNFFNISATVDDDCQDNINVKMNIEHDSDSGECENTMFHLTPEQSVTGCDDSESFQNPLLGLTSKIKVNLDEIAPVVECGFHDDPSWENVVQGKTLFHYGNKGLQNSNFFYKVKENCAAAVNVEVNLKSNQFEYDSVIGRLKSFKIHGYNEQTYLYYSADSCKEAGPYCELDGSIPLNVRFYEIEVRATDSAGHFGMDTCNVIIVPPCKYYDEGCENGDKEPYKNYYKRHFVLDIVGQSVLRHDVTSASTKWQKDLKTLKDKKPMPTKSPKAYSLRSPNNPL